MKTMRKIAARLIRLFIYLTLGLSVSVLFAGIGLYFYITPKLPSIESLKDVKFQVPLRIYSSDGKLIGEFGEKKRLPLSYDEVPTLMVQAVLSAEDDRFFEHPGVDYQGILRAVAILLTTGKKTQGGSTITMQVARNFFLSSEKTFLRKFNEILLALKIEQAIPKEEILSLYLNKIYLGNRAYGVGAAAKIYYGLDINQLNLAQLAMIAGLPKAPSRYNPIVNPERSTLRRDYVLRRMHELNHIKSGDYSDAIQQPVTAKLHRQNIEIHAPYVAEMARKKAVERYGNSAYTAGYTIHTTIKSPLQNAANNALRNALINYELRHGYRGPEAHLDALDAADPQAWKIALQKLPSVPLLPAGVVIDTTENSATVYLKDNRVIWLCWRGMRWAAPYVDGNRAGPPPKTTADILTIGDIIRVQALKQGWLLAQTPRVSGALVSLRSNDGAIQSIVGGYDFYQSKFNRAVQAKRQPGSNFKPFIYSSAIAKGYTASSLINDAPVVFDDPGLEDTWRPKNYSGKVFGPTRLREALVNSRNLVSIRLLRAVGIDYAISYAERFGFNPKELPRNLSLALGSLTVTPLAVARGYAILSNGGYMIEPYLITKIIGPNHEVLFTSHPPTVCDTCSNPANMNASLNNDEGFERMEDLLNNEDNSLAPNIAKRVVDAQNIYIMTSILRDIVQHGTGRRAKVLKRHDLAGKTGTTNDQRDAWFSGFNGKIATTAWVGFDTPAPLGDRESGAGAALPMWIKYMRVALKNMPETPLKQPPGMVTVRIDPKTGLLANANFPNARFETFREKYVPKRMAEASPSTPNANNLDPTSTDDEMNIF